jgi:predicted glycosyltransferase
METLSLTAAPMRLLIEAHHPAHIHFFKNAIRTWVDHGAQVKLIGRDRDVMKQLLSVYDYIPSTIATVQHKNSHFPLQEMLQRQGTIAREVYDFGPDLVLSLMGSYTQPAALFRIPSFVFTDSEFQHFNHRIAHPFASRIYTPMCFWKDLGPKQRRYKGYHELAFLHPNYFTPREEVLEMLGAKKGEYIIVRVSAWDTLHDVGQSGFGSALGEFIEAALTKYQVFIVPERGILDPKYEAYRMQVRPDYYHDALAFARFVVTEGASTASEAACLGVPAIYLNTTSRGYLDDIHMRYKLVNCHTDARSALRDVHEWLVSPPDLEECAEAKQRLIQEHIDVTDYVVREVEQACNNGL